MYDVSRLRANNNVLNTYDMSDRRLRVMEFEAVYKEVTVAYRKVH
jgi:hypothetical protein